MYIQRCITRIIHVQAGREVSRRSIIEVGPAEGFAQPLKKAVKILPNTAQICDAATHKAEGTRYLHYSTYYYAHGQQNLFYNDI